MEKWHNIWVFLTEESLCWHEIQWNHSGRSINRL